MQSLNVKSLRNLYDLALHLVQTQISCLATANTFIDVYDRKTDKSSNFLQDLVCNCRGKPVCASNFVCLEQNLSDANLCPCQGTEIFKNVNANRRDNLDDEDE